jgi:anti-anti-sigma factor
VTAHSSDKSSSPRAKVGSPPHFDVQTDVVSRIAYVRGEVDIATAPTLFEVVEFLTTIGDGDVTLDLEGVTFMDASGLGTVVKCRNHLGQLGHRLAIVNASHTIQRVFDLGALSLLVGHDGSRLSRT